MEQPRFSLKDTLALLKATFGTYAACAISTTRALTRNWLIIPASIAAFVAYLCVLMIVSALHLGFAGGFIAGLAQISLLTLYYNWIRQTSEKAKLRRTDLLFFDYSLFSAIINVGFIFFIAQLLLEACLPPGYSPLVLPVVNLAICILFNPAAEIIQRYQRDGLSTLREAYEFVLENWIEWFIPFVLVLLPWIMINPGQPLAALSGTDPLLPAMPLIRASVLFFHLYLHVPDALYGTLFGIILSNWFMVFRAQLFQELAGSSRRKRAYQLRNR